MTTRVIAVLPEGGSMASMFVRNMLVLGVSQSIADEFLTPAVFQAGTTEAQFHAAREQFANQVADRLLSGRTVVTIDSGPSARFFSVANKLPVS